jgi:serine phosphatase RsbU (regulator of sigma subunit)
MLLAVGHVASQNATVIDSLNTVLNNTKEDTAKVNTLYKLALEYRSAAPGMHKDYLNKSYNLAVRLNYKKGISDNLYSLGLIDNSEGNYEKAMSLFVRSLKIREETGDQEGISDCYNMIGWVYNLQGDFAKAVLFVKKGLFIREALKDNRRIAISLNNLGVIYYYKGEYEEALKSNLRSLKIREQIGNKKDINQSLSNLALTYAGMGDTTKALEYYDTSLKLAKELNNLTLVGLAYNNFGNIYSGLRKNEEALKNSLKALEIFEQIKNKAYIGLALNCIAEINSNKGDFKKAEEYALRALKINEELGDKRNISTSLLIISENYRKQKNYIKALEYADKSVVLIKKTGALEIIGTTYQTISTIYEDLKDYEKALVYSKLYTQNKDSMFTSEKTKSMAELQARYETDKKEKEIELLIKDNQLKAKSFQEQRIIRIALIVGLSLLLVLSFTLYNRYRFKQKANLLLENQKKEIEQKNSMITDSIDYAKTIQDAILPSDKVFYELFPDSFILYKPKAIVSGDFYWVGQDNTKMICAVADCTGHGVPGAFMSLLGNNILENVIQKKEFLKPASILDSLNEELITVMAQDQERASVKNGMDIALITIDKTTKQLEYAGAHNSLYLIRDGELCEIKADKTSIGSLYKGEAIHFTNHTEVLKKDDQIYLFSDGYPDQIGGLNRKKFYYQPFKELLLSICQLEMNDQKKRLDEKITSWRGELEQTDDILVVGIRL